MPKNRKTRKEKIMSLTRQNASVNKQTFIPTDVISDTMAPSYSVLLPAQQQDKYTDKHLSHDLIKTTLLSVSVIVGELILFYVLQLHK